MPKAPPAKSQALLERLNRGASRNAKLSALAPVEFGRSGDQVQRYRLGNGLTVLLLVDRSAPVLSYHTWYRVGSRHEQPGKTGLAHLFEHLMFNETKHLPAGEFDRRIEAAGGDTNASTWTDWTHYYADLPASELDLIVQLESDRMANLVLRKPQLVSEKEVVANERRYRVDDDVEGTVAERLYALAFRRHPYRWPTIGWMRDIQAFTLADLRAFYKTFYAPNNATLVIVGNVNPERTLGLIQRSYGGLARARLPEWRCGEEGVQRKERLLTLDRPTPTAKLSLGYPAPAFGDPDYPVLAVVNELLFSGRNSRLFRKLVEGGALASEVNGSIAPFEFPGLYDIWVSMREGCAVEQALSVVEIELQRLVDEPVNINELDRIKRRLELGFLTTLETASGKAEQLGFFEVVCGDAARLFTRLDEYRAVTPADVQRVARRYFDSSKRTQIRVSPTAGTAA